MRYFWHKAKWVGPALGLVIVVVGGAVFLQRSSSAEDLELKGISAESLAEFGVRLEKPGEGAVASVDQTRAVESAVGAHAGAKVQEALLARIYVKSERDVVRNGQLIWAVSLDPATVIPAPIILPGLIPVETEQASDPHVTFSVEFIDANSGKLLFGIETTHDPALPD